MLRGVNSGKFDVRLVIQNNVFTTDSVTNQRKDSWSTVSTVWAQRMTKGGRLGFEADQQVANNKETYLVRYSSTLASLNAKHRIYESGTTDYLFITTVEKQKREGWILITAEKKDA